MESYSIESVENMENKKKPSEVETNEDHSSGSPSQSNRKMMLSTQNRFQPIGPNEIKKEGDIKQEPLSVGESVVVSTSNYRNERQVPGFNECDDEYDFDVLSLDEAKIEVKKESDDKEKEEPKRNADSKEEATDGQQDEVDLMLAENDNNAQAHNTQKRDYILKNSRKQHECNICGYSASYKSLLNRHMLKHTGEKPHGCDLCPKRFKRMQHLHSHMKVHVEEFLFHCPVCLEGFDEKNERMTHEMNCKALRYECHLCKESFGLDKANTMIHLRVHSGFEPFECTQCSKQFKTKSNLNKHIKLHAGPRLFRCSNCRMAFPHQDEKNAHGEKCDRDVFECYDCGKSFGLHKSNLVHHMRTHSGETPFECQHCSKQFKQKSHLNKHMISHAKKLPFKCSICQEGFLKQTQCKVHQRNCDRRCYECHLCTKFFGSLKTNLKRHMRTHSGDQPFQCQLCHIRFTQKGNLKRHISLIHNKKNP